MLLQAAEWRRDDWCWRVQQVDEDVARLEIAQPCGLNHTGQDLLGLRAAWRAIPARHLAIHHRGPDRLLGTPVRGVEREIKQEAEQRWEFRGQMVREPLTV